LLHNHSAVVVNVFLSKNKSKNKGLISAYRRTKPTLMLTIPHSYKVVYNGFICAIVGAASNLKVV